LGELAKVYGGESGWEVRENPNSPALFAGLKVSDLSPANELGSSEEALNLELFQDDLWHQGPRVQNREDLVPQPQQPHPRRAGRMGKAGRRAAPNGEISETSQTNGGPLGGAPQPNLNVTSGNSNTSATNVSGFTQRGRSTGMAGAMAMATVVVTTGMDTVAAVCTAIESAVAEMDGLAMHEFLSVVPCTSLGTNS